MSDSAELNWAAARAGQAKRAGSISAVRGGTASVSPPGSLPVWLRMLCCLPIWLCLLGAKQPTAKDQAKETELRQVRQRIETVRRSIQADAERRDSLVGELKQADERIAEARSELGDVRSQRQEAEQQLAALEAQRQQTERELAGERSSLSRELQLAYMNGRSEPLKLWLNQQDPAQLGRMLGYYGYFSRARAAQITRINDHLAHLALLAEDIEQQTQTLRDLEQKRSRSAQSLESARKQRAGTLQKVEVKLKNNNERLGKLQADAATLERLVEQLRREAERAAAAARERAAKTGKPVNIAPPAGRGSWPWPVKGNVLARFGQLRAGGPLKWDGMVIGADAGTSVRAPAPGRVLYADWLPGLGLLLVLDHGGGIMSLYGHNEQLYRKVGDQVARGDVLSVVGDTGVQEQSGVYLEFRNGKQPVDPLNWLGKP